MRVYEWDGGLTLVSPAARVSRLPPTTTGARSHRHRRRTRTGQFNDKFTVGANNNIPAGGFVEGGINLTALSLDDGCSTTFLAETRSSPVPRIDPVRLRGRATSTCASPPTSRPRSRTTRARATASSRSTRASRSSTRVDLERSKRRGRRAPSSSSSAADELEPRTATPSARSAATTSRWLAVRPTSSRSRRRPSRRPPSPTTTASASSTRPQPDPSTSPTRAHQQRPPSASRSSPPTFGSSRPRTRAPSAPVSRSASPCSGATSAKARPRASSSPTRCPPTPASNWAIAGSTGPARRAPSPGHRFPSPDLQRRLDQRPHAGGPGGCRRQHQEQRLGDRHERDEPASCAVIDNTGVITSTNDGTRPEPRPGHGPVPGRQGRRRRPKTAQVNAGDTATFTIVGHNIGPGTATGVDADRHPAGRPRRGRSAADTGDVLHQHRVGTLRSCRCNFGTLDRRRDHGRITAHVRPPRRPTARVIPNIATVDADQRADSPTAGNNADPGAITSTVRRHPASRRTRIRRAGQRRRCDRLRHRRHQQRDGTAYGVVGDRQPPGAAFTGRSTRRRRRLLVSGSSAPVLTCDRRSLAAGAASVHIAAPTDADRLRHRPQHRHGHHQQRRLEDSTTRRSSSCARTSRSQKVGNGPDQRRRRPVFTSPSPTTAPATAKDVTLTDQLPAGTWTLGGANADACAISGTDLLTCASATSPTTRPGRSPSRGTTTPPTAARSRTR